MFNPQIQLTIFDQRIWSEKINKYEVLFLN